MKDFAHLVEPEGKSMRPDELVVEVDLPLLKSAANLNVDIMETKLVLNTEPPGLIGFHCCDISKIVMG
jgi:hypothetical protein